MREKGSKYIGIDIGGTKTRIVLFEKKRWRQLQKFVTPQKEKVFASKLKSVISTPTKKYGVSGVGIGTAGVVNGTTLVFSPNIPFVKNFDFRTIVPKNIALRVDNDARCFARAEFLERTGRKYRSVFALMLGTGIGRAYAKNGKIQKIKRFEFPEKWEHEYQKIQYTPRNKKLVTFLGTKLLPTIKKLKPDAIVVAGGVLDTHPDFFKNLKKELTLRGIAVPIQKARFGKITVAKGAVLLFN